MARTSSKARGASGQGAVAAPIRKLKAFWDGAASEPFTYGRLNWVEGEGPRESIAPRFLKKRQPVASEDGGDSADQVHPLLPGVAQEAFRDFDYLLQSYEDRVPASDTLAFVQLTMRFPQARNLHHPFEVVRAWTRGFFVEGQGCPALVVLHAPHLAGSLNPPHVHVLVLPRVMGPLAWGAFLSKMGTDRSRAEARQSWEAYRDAHLWPARCG